jgi:hypothetical protein
MSTYGCEQRDKDVINATPKLKKRYQLFDHLTIFYPQYWIIDHQDHTTTKQQQKQFFVDVHYYKNLLVLWTRIISYD